MTLKQERFVHHYIEEAGNGTLAAIKAGYSPHTSTVIASENLRKPNVAEAIAEKTRAIYTPERLKQRLNDVLDCPDNQTVLVRAIELGMRSEAMLTDRSINENYNVDQSREAMSKAADEALAELTKARQV